MYLNSDLTGDIDMRVMGNVLAGVHSNVHDNVQIK